MTDISDSVAGAKQEVRDEEKRRRLFKELAGKLRRHSPDEARIQMILADQSAAILKIKRRYLRRLLELQRRIKSRSSKRVGLKSRQKGGFCRCQSTASQ